MAHMLPYSNPALQAGPSSNRQARTKVLASVDFVYEIVWSAGEPSSTQPQSPLIGLRKPRGSIRITGPTTDDSIWKASEPPSTQHQDPPIEYVSITNPPGYAPSSPRVTRSAVDNDIWSADEPLSTQHQRRSIGYESMNDSLFDLFGSPRMTDSAVDSNISIAREPPSPWSPSPSSGYESTNNSPPNHPSSSRITDSAANTNIRMAGEAPSLGAQEQSTAGEFPYNSPPRTLGTPRITNSAVNDDLWTAGKPSSSRSQRPSIDGVAAGPAYGLPPKSLGNLRNTGPGADGSILSKFQSQKYDARSSPIPQPISGEKIPCVAKLHVESLGALSICSYDRVTDSFSNFSVNDAEWGHQKGYRDYGDVQMSTKKWSQGSWVSVKDDNGNEFIFVTVGRDHGLVRVWRPNLVAKRAVRVGATEVTSGEVLRLGLLDDADF